MSCVLVINNVPEDISGAVRLGGHVLAGVWLPTSSALAPVSPIRIIDNVPEDISGAGYSFVSDISLRPVLAPAS